MKKNNDSNIAEDNKAVCCEKHEHHHEHEGHCGCGHDHHKHVANMERKMKKFLL